jgi:hypothetical protein
MKPKTEPEQLAYEEMATALAVYVYRRCTEHDGYVGFTHCGENGFDVAPHILDRLNVMACNSQHATFAINWRPGQQLPIWRNSNEPSHHEFAIAFVTAVRWQLGSIGGGFSRPKAAFDISAQEPHRNYLPGGHHYGYAMWLVTNCLQRMGLGDGLDQGFFMLNERGEAVPEYWKYWTPQNRQRHLLKCQPPRRLRKELKLQGVIDPDRPRYL